MFNLRLKFSILYTDTIKYKNNEIEKGLVNKKNKGFYLHKRYTEYKSIMFLKKQNLFLILLD